MPITCGFFSCLEPIYDEVIAEVIAVSVEGNYLHTTKVPWPDSDEDASEIESDEENELNRSVGHLPRGEEEYIYKLRVERADRNTQIYSEAQFKDVYTQTWADLTARASTNEVLNDDEDWEIRLQAINRKSEACVHHCSRNGPVRALMEQER